MRYFKKFVLANGVAVAMAVSALGMSVPSGATTYPTSAATPAFAALIKYTPQSVLATMTTKRKLRSYENTAATAVAKGVKEIDVFGYTDNLSCGTPTHCVHVSLERATGVANRIRADLLALGSFIPVIPLGRGSANPLASNATAAGRMANNRTVIVYITG